MTHLVQDATIYKQVTISKHDGVCYRGTKIGKEIGRKRQFLIDLKKYPNTFMFVRQGVSDGALGIAPPEVDGCIATENMPMFSVKGIEVDYLNLVLKSIDFKRQLDQIPTLGSAQKAIHERQLLEIEIPLPSADEQREVVKAFEAHRTNVLDIIAVTDQQLTYLTQLRQALLREAMQGQLLPQDPTDEPAAVLLQKLQAEKAKLGKAGKRKQKELFAEEVEAVEGPYQLPNNWTWCKLGEVVERSDSGWSPACLNHPAADDIWGVLKTTAVQKLEFLADENKQLPASLSPRPQYEVQAGDILVTRAGPKNRVGVCCVVNEVRPKLMISDKLIRLHLYESCCVPKFIALALNIGVSAQFLEDVKTGMADSQVNISQDNLRATIIPLPPLAEQHRIVAKLEQLIQHCDALEQRIRESRRLAEQLLQTALREALAPPADAEVPEEEAELELVGTEAEAAAAHRRRGQPAKKAYQPGDYVEFGDLFSQPEA
jgi:type I restriction enzyme S subunit